MFLAFILVLALALLGFVAFDAAKLYLANHRSPVLVLELNSTVNLHGSRGRHSAKLVRILGDHLIMRMPSRESADYEKGEVITAVHKTQFEAHTFKAEITGINFESGMIRLDHPEKLTRVDKPSANKSDDDLAAN